MFCIGLGMGLSTCSKSGIFNLIKTGTFQAVLTIEAIRSVVVELLTPSNNQTPYVRGVVAIAHAMLGAALIAPFGAYGACVAVVLGLAYWFIKERGDLMRGGAWRDGVEDALFVSMGAFYGFAWWPVIVLSFAGLIMIIAEAKK